MELAQNQPRPAEGIPKEMECPCRLCHSQPWSPLLLRSRFAQFSLPQLVDNWEISPGTLPMCLWLSSACKDWCVNLTWMRGRPSPGPFVPLTGHGSSVKWRTVRHDAKDLGGHMVYCKKETMHTIRNNPLRLLSAVVWPQCL